MAVLSWGKCKIETTPSVNGAPSTAWKEIDTPKEETTKLTTTLGTETTATEEGGELVDVRYGKSTYTLEWDSFVKKGQERPFDDTDGVIQGEHAFRITPEDETCEGIQIDRSKVQCQESFSTKEGKMLHYVTRCLKPAAGKTVKPYTKGD